MIQHTVTFRLKHAKCSIEEKDFLELDYVEHSA